MFFEIERAEHILNELRDSIKINPVRLEDVQISEGREKTGDYREFKKDELWGGYDSWCWFKSTMNIPAELSGKNIGFSLCTGREGQWNSLNPQFVLYVNGELICGMDTNHTEVILGQLNKPVTLELFAYSGTLSMAPNQYASKDEKYHPKRIEFSAFLYEHNAEIERLYYNLKPVLDTAKLYDKKDNVRIELTNHLTKVINMLDLRIVGTDDFFTSVAKANDYMENEFYEKACGHNDIIANCVGHTHIDVAWLWTLDQTKEKVIKSFSTVLHLMDQYPDYIFMSSQPQLYKYLKEKAPDLYEKVKERVKEGRWDPEGSMWLEADCNLSSGESLVRQVIHGKQFFQKEFGKENKILWLPDVFGYSAALPQILKKSSIDYFVTSKISWNEYNQMPCDTFSWEGIDGTEIFTQFINATEMEYSPIKGFFSTYNAKIHPAALLGGWKNYQQKPINNETLVSFGYGDGGGGPTREMLEMHTRMKKGIPGCPKTKMTTTLEALESIEKNAVSSGRLPKWVGELYLEYHRGTYTSMARNKRYNRKAEFTLQNAESLSVINSLLFGKKYPSEKLYQNWELVLLNQFHDIIPGSSIKEVYEDSREQYEEVLSSGNEIITDTIKRISQRVSTEGVLVYNPTSFMRCDIAEVDGKKLYAENIPAHGYKVIKRTEPSKNPSEMIVHEDHLENDFFVMKLDENANFVSIYDKKNKREVLKKGSRGNVLTAYEDKPYNHDAWDINIYYTEKSWDVLDVVSIKVIENTEICGTIEIKRSFLNSIIVQKISIYRDVPRIDFDTYADWKEKHILLKTHFPVDVLASKATYEIQYGNLERPTHFNTSWDTAKFEVCGHKWADVSESGYGVSILNDCKYGHDIKDSNIGLTLIKSAAHPNVDADREEHYFKYSLYPHAGDFREGETIKQAYFINNPLICENVYSGGKVTSEFSLATVSDENVVIEVIKEAYDHKGIIVRMYEAHGKRTSASIYLGVDIENAYSTDLMENVISEFEVENNTVEFSIKPYEILTFKLIPAKKEA